MKYKDMATEELKKELKNCNIKINHYLFVTGNFGKIWYDIVDVEKAKDLITKELLEREDK